MLKPECIRCGNRVGWIGVGANLFMVVLKIIVGITSGSKACLADALHSSSNIITAFAIFVSRKLTGKPMDDDHQYGHGKVEFVAAALVSVLIIVLTIVLVITALRHVIYEPQPPPHLEAMVVAILSIAINEMLFRYFRCVGTRLNSQTIIANAWANRADCFSSLAVVIGVIGARFGFHHLDPIAAVVVACIILKVSIACIKDSIAGLMDKSVASETIEIMRDIVSGVSAVKRIDHIKARLLGDKIWVEVGLQVTAKHSIEECDRIRKQVQRCIMDNVHEVGFVLVDFKALEEVG